MVAFNLPLNSRIGQGQTFKAQAGTKHVREFKIYRWNPDDGKNPRTDTYEVDLDAYDAMFAVVLATRSTGHEPTEIVREP